MEKEETGLEMVRRHVRQGAARVAQQFQLVAELRADGRSTEIAEQLLASFEDIQRQHEAHLARLEGPTGRKALLAPNILGAARRE